MNTQPSILLSEQKREALKIKIELLHEVLDNIPEGIFATDAADRIIIYNRDVEQTEQMSRNEVMGRREKDVYAYDPHYSFNKLVTEKIKRIKAPVFGQKYAQKIGGGKTVHIIFDSYPFYYDGHLGAIFTVGQRLDKFNEFVAKTLSFKKQMLAEGWRTPSSTRYRLENIIGSDPQFKSYISMAGKIAKYNSSVMIIGETGTGKELLAQGIHNASRFAQGPFIAVNCAAIPENLLEGILFGTVPGAFSEALDMPGLFEQAQDGTIFFDEVNSMPPTLQAKLLRAIQDKKVRRLGGGSDIPVNCRIISATNIDPFHNDYEQVIRTDLLFRLATVSINIPPLRERRGDIILLSRYFIRRINKEYGSRISGLEPKLEKILLQYNWPGNVRELNNVIESSMCLIEPGNGGLLRLDHLPEYFLRGLESGQKQTNFFPGLSGQKITQLLADYEKKLIAAALVKNGGNISATAKELQISRPYLHTKLKTIGLDRYGNEISVSANEK